MTQFRPGGANNPYAGDNGRRTTIRHVEYLKQPQNWMFLPERVSEGGYHVIRVHPMHENGVEGIHVAPDIAEILAKAKADKNRDVQHLVLDNTVFIAPVVQNLGMDAHSYSYIASSRKDSAGADVNDSWSPTMIVVNRMLNWKKFVEQEVAPYKTSGMKHKDVYAALEQKHPLIPKKWWYWFAFMQTGPVRRITPAGFVQCDIHVIDGTQVLDANGTPSYYPNGIAMLGITSLNSLVTGLSTKYDPLRPLDIENNMLGDFCTLNGGYMMNIRKGAENAYSVSLDARRPAPLQGYYWTDWTDILRAPCVEEQIEMMITALGPEAVAHSLRDNEAYVNYLPEQIRGLCPNLPAAKEYMAGNSGANTTEKLYTTHINGENYELTVTQIQEAVEAGHQNIMIFSEKKQAWMDVGELLRALAAPRPPAPPANTRPPAPPPRAANTANVGSNAAVPPARPAAPPAVPPATPARPAAPPATPAAPPQRAAPQAPATPPRVPPANPMQRPPPPAHPQHQTTAPANPVPPVRPANPVPPARPANPVPPPPSTTPDLTGENTQDLMEAVLDHYEDNTYDAVPEDADALDGLPPQTPPARNAVPPPPTVPGAGRPPVPGNPGAPGNQAAPGGQSAESYAEGVKSRVENALRNVRGRGGNA